MQKEFSYPLKVSDIPLGGMHCQMLAKPENLPYLAEILQVSGVKSMEADFYIKPDHKTSLLEVSGHIKALITLCSVVSLENFDSAFDFDFSTLFDEKATLQSQKEEGDDWDKDMPEIVINDQIDLGDIAIEQVALRLDDYPRMEGEEFNFTSEFDKDEDDKQSPFAVLAQIRK